MVNCHASVKGLFAGIVCFSCTMISIILYVIFQSTEHDIVQLTSFPSTGVNKDHSQTRVKNTQTISHHRDLTSSITSESERMLYSVVMLDIVNSCLLILSLCATIWLSNKIRKLAYRRTATRKRYMTEEETLLNMFFC